MAASRTSKHMNTAMTITGRLSFGKIREPLEVPDLLALQTESFDWLLGNERWQARVAAAKAEGRDDVPDRSGLEEIFEEISPIEDFSGSMSLTLPRPPLRGGQVLHRGVQGAGLDLLRPAVRHRRVHEQHHR